MKTKKIIVNGTITEEMFTNYKQIKEMLDGETKRLNNVINSRYEDYIKLGEPEIIFHTDKSNDTIYYKFYDRKDGCIAYELNQLIEVEE